MATGYSVNLPITGGSFVEIKRNEIERTERVGKGSFGKVYKARWRGRCVAVKDIDTDSEKEVNAFRNEQFSRVSHENIVILFGACTEMSNCCLVMEYTEYGSLHKLMHNTPIPYTTAHAISWAHQCAEAVDYLHSMEPKPLLHRDLKPQNLLLFNDGEILKICDFGTVRDKATIMTKDTGSVPWMAPEVFDSTELYSEKCDVYSFGIILWEIVHRKEPFSGMGWAQILMAVYKGERSPIHAHCPKLIKGLITKCWDPLPENRPMMKAVIEQLLNVHSDEPLPPHGQFVENRDEAIPSDVVAATLIQLRHSSDVVNSSITHFLTVSATDTTTGEKSLNVHSDEPLPTQGQFVEDRDEAIPSDVVAATLIQLRHSSDVVNSSITHVLTVSATDTTTGEKSLNVHSDEPLPTQGQFVEDRDEAIPSDVVAATLIQLRHSSDVVNSSITQVLSVSAADTTTGEQLLNVNSDEPLPTQGQFVENRDETNPSAEMGEQPCHSRDVVNSSITQVLTVSAADTTTGEKSLNVNSDEPLPTQGQFVEDRDEAIPSDVVAATLIQSRHSSDVVNSSITQVLSVSAADTTTGEQLLNVNSDEPLPTQGQFVENRDETNPSAEMGEQPCHSRDEVNSSIKEFSIHTGQMIQKKWNLNAYQAVLHTAVRNGDSKAVERYLKGGTTKVNVKDNFDLTPLHFAACYGQAAIVIMLLSNGANINGTDITPTPLYFAAFNGYVDVVNILLEKGADANLGERTTPLIAAAKNDHKQVVKKLIKYGAGVNATDIYGFAPIHYAALNGHEEIVEILYDARADFDVVNNCGETPLLYAAQKGYAGIVQTLLCHATYPIKQTDYGLTLLHIAIHNDHTAIVRVLLDRSTEELDVPTINGQTPLHVAADTGNNEIVEILLQYRATVHKMDNGGRTPLHYAARKGHEEIVKNLLNNGASIYARGNNGLTPLLYATLRGHDKIVNILLREIEKLALKNCKS